ncbi:MAG: 4Fe-4S dicluster domain-containing protein, partial [Candidatus Bathycorpusculaceae bacterium]
MSETQEYVPSVIKAEEMNPKFKYEMSKMHGAERLMLCFQCGTCTADCPISRFSDFYRPRKIARMVQLGLKGRLLSDEALWLCSSCFTCVDHCPQGVEIAGIVRVLRNLSVK